MATFLDFLAQDEAYQNALKKHQELHNDCHAASHEIVKHATRMRGLLMAMNLTSEKIIIHSEVESDDKIDRIIQDYTTFSSDDLYGDLNFICDFISKGMIAAARGLIDANEALEKARAADEQSCEEVKAIKMAAFKRFSDGGNN